MCIVGKEPRCFPGFLYLLVVTFVCQQDTGLRVVLNCEVAVGLFDGFIIIKRQPFLLDLLQSVLLGL